MALVPCPDCGWETSTLADKCPRCGRPVASFSLAGGPPSTADPAWVKVRTDLDRTWHSMSKHGALLEEVSDRDRVSSSDVEQSFAIAAVTLVIAELDFKLPTAPVQQGTTVRPPRPELVKSWTIMRDHMTLLQQIADSNRVSSGAAEQAFAVAALSLVVAELTFGVP